MRQKKKKKEKVIAQNLELKIQNIQNGGKVVMALQMWLSL